jgi:hypothetical protein
MYLGEYIPRIGILRPLLAKPKKKYLAGSSPNGAATARTMVGKP